MNIQIHATWENKLARGVYDPSAARYDEMVANHADGRVLDVHISLLLSVVVDDSSILEKEEELIILMFCAIS